MLTVESDCPVKFVKSLLTHYRISYDVLVTLYITVTFVNISKCISLPELTMRNIVLKHLLLFGNVG